MRLDHHEVLYFRGADPPRTGHKSMLTVRGYHLPAGAHSMEPSAAPVSSKPTSQTQVASLPSTVQISLSPQDFASHGSGYARGEVHRESVRCMHEPCHACRRGSPVESNRTIRTCNHGEISPKSTDNSPHAATVHIVYMYSFQSKQTRRMPTAHNTRRRALLRAQLAGRFD